MKCEKEYIKKDKRCFERCSCTLHAVLVPFPLQREKERILHFIYKAFRALRLLKELEEKCYRERNVTVQTKGGLQMAYSLAYKCSPRELPGRNISRLFPVCELPLLLSVPQNGALQTNHVN